MSYCKYCGKQLADGEKCSCEGAKKSGKNYKKLLIPAAVIITLVIGVMCVVSYVQSGLDLADYILIEGAEGFNGQGVLNYSIDSEALYMDMVDNSAWEKADEDNFEELLTNQISQNEEVDHALKSIELSATKEEGLSNGDKITVTAKFSNTLNYNFSHHFKDASVEFVFVVVLIHRCLHRIKGEVSVGVELSQCIHVLSVQSVFFTLVRT